MKKIYNISMYMYQSLIYLSSLFNSKAKRWVDGRKKQSVLINNMLKEEENIAWFHCASLGEYEQAKSVIKGYKAKYPEHRILITFFSSSGYDVCKRINTEDFVFYLPIDTEYNARNFINTINPTKAIFIKYEFWFNNFFLAFATLIISGEPSIPKTVDFLHLVEIRSEIFPGPHPRSKIRNSSPRGSYFLNKIESSFTKSFSVTEKSASA